LLPAPPSSVHGVEALNFAEFDLETRIQ